MCATSSQEKSSRYEGEIRWIKLTGDVAHVPQNGHYQRQLDFKLVHDQWREEQSHDDGRCVQNRKRVRSKAALKFQNISYQLRIQIFQKFQKFLIVIRTYRRID